MLGRIVDLVIDGHQCRKNRVDMRVPQESLLSLILFSIYLNRVFKEVEAKVERCMTT